MQIMRQLLPRSIDLIENKVLDFIILLPLWNAARGSIVSFSWSIFSNNISSKRKSLEQMPPHKEQPQLFLLLRRFNFLSWFCLARNMFKWVNSFLCCDRSNRFGAFLILSFVGLSFNGGDLWLWETAELCVLDLNAVVEGRLNRFLIIRFSWRKFFPSILLYNSTSFSVIWSLSLSSCL